MQTEGSSCLSDPRPPFALSLAWTAVGKQAQSRPPPITQFYKPWVCTSPHLPHSI